MKINFKITDRFQKAVEKAFFKGKTTKWSKQISFGILNLLIMLVLFFLILNRVVYNWTGTLYAEGTGFRLDFLGDNYIPFVPEMAIFYVYLFYSMVIVSMLFFGFGSSEKGYALGWSLVLINFIAVIVYIFFPVSTYWWRQELLADPIVGNFWADTMYKYYQTDVSFNCLPSLHAAVSFIVFYAWYRYYKIKPDIKTKIIAIITFLIAFGVVLSTLFVKQHYIIDEITGVVLALIVGKYMFDYLWKDIEKS